MKNKKEEAEESQKFGSETSMHGIKYLFSSQSALTTRIIWFTVIILMAAGFTANFTSSLIQYYKYDSIISTRVEVNQEMQLPAVTFCSNNLFKYSKLSKEPDVFDAMRAISVAYIGVNATGNNNSNDANFTTLKSISVSQALRSYSFNVSEIFVECKISVGIVVDCDKYISFAFTDAGFCYTFQSDKHVFKNGPVTTKNPGNKYGISFVIDMNPDEYALPATIGTGFMIIVHNASTYPIAETKSFMVSPGKDFFMSMKHIVVRNLPKPYSREDCLRKEEVHRESNKSYGMSYSEEGCRAKCITEKTASCRCNFFSLDLAACSFYEYLTCTSEMSYVNSSEVCDCLATCEVNDYDIQMSSMDFPNNLGKAYAQLQNWPVENLTEMRRRYTRITIYYDSLTSTVTQQVPSMNEIELLANIGGQLGLFLGASVITLVEAIYLCGVSITQYVCSKKNGSQTNQTTVVVFNDPSPGE